MMPEGAPHVETDTHYSGNGTGNSSGSSIVTADLQASRSPRKWRTHGKFIYTSSLKKTIGPSSHYLSLIVHIAHLFVWGFWQTNNGKKLGPFLIHLRRWPRSEKPPAAMPNYL